MCINPLTVIHLHVLYIIIYILCGFKNIPTDAGSDIFKCKNRHVWTTTKYAEMLLLYGYEYFNNKNDKL